MDILIVIFFATFKFALTFPLAIYTLHFNFWETLVYINTGGAIGVFFFAYLYKYLIILWNRIFPKLKDSRCTRSRKTFSKRNRRLVHIKQKYGMAGIAILNPVLLSIPVGVFLMVKYYPRKRSIFLYLISGQVVWSFLYTVFYFNLFR